MSTDRQAIDKAISAAEDAHKRNDQRALVRLRGQACAELKVARGEAYIAWDYVRASCEAGGRNVPPEEFERFVRLARFHAEDVS